jgi:hypothetical protein
MITKDHSHATVEASPVMHTSLRVIGVLSDLLVRVVLGVGCRRWTTPEPMGQSARILAVGGGATARPAGGPKR